MTRFSSKTLLLVAVFWGMGYVVDSMATTAKEIIVRKNSDVPTIAHAIKLAQKGDHIIVTAGVYEGNKITINKPVTITGRKGAILDGMGKYEIMVVTADSVTIEYLTFRNAGVSYIEDNAAIRLNEVKYCTIAHNTLENNFFGIYLAKSSYCTVSDNKVTGNGRKETASGGGIHLWNCNNIVIDGNYIRNSRDGIYFEFVDHTTITHNVSEYNIRYGLHLMYSKHDTYTHNTFRHNRAGGVIMYSNFVTMKYNDYQYNWGPSNDGLLLKELNDGVVEHNRFFKNSSAIYSEGSNRIKIDHNQFEQNGWAVKIMANSTSNIFNNNNFLDNAFDVITSGEVNRNNFDHNYWSDYQGYDLDHNGIGDVPYRPVSLFSFVVNEQPTSIMLMRSMFIQILSIAERAFPMLTPITLVDNQPLMQRVHDTTQ